MIVATALVMLMTIPGLALFYGGSGKTEGLPQHHGDVLCNVLHREPALGDSTDSGFPSGQISAVSSGAPKRCSFQVSGPTASMIWQRRYPEYIFIVYQLTFAAITVALASGAYIERMKFSAWILFSVLWMTLVYIPVAHWVWGGGFLSKMGALDFAGGTVVHINAGSQRSSAH